MSRTKFENMINSISATAVHTMDGDLLRLIAELVDASRTKASTSDVIKKFDNIKKHIATLPLYEKELGELNEFTRYLNNLQNSPAVTAPA